MINFESIVTESFMNPKSFWSANKIIGHALGLDASVLFSELVYLRDEYSKEGTLVDGRFFYRIAKDLEFDLSLGRRRVEAAIKSLVDAELIETTKMGLPAKTYYAICNDDVLLKKIDTWYKQKYIDWVNHQIEKLVDKGKFEDVRLFKLDQQKKNPSLYGLYIIECTECTTSNKVTSKKEIKEKEIKNIGAIAPSHSEIGDDDLQKNLFSIQKAETTLESKLKELSKLSLTARALAKAELVRSKELHLVEMKNEEIYAYFCKKQKESFGVSPLDDYLPKDIMKNAKYHGKIMLDALRIKYKLADDEILDALDKIASAYEKEDRSEFNCITGNAISKMTDLVNKMLGKSTHKVKPREKRNGWIQDFEKENAERRERNRERRS